MQDRACAKACLVGESGNENSIIFCYFVENDSVFLFTDCWVVLLAMSVTQCKISKRVNV